MSRTLSALFGAALLLVTAVATIALLAARAPAVVAQPAEAYSLIDTWANRSGLSPAGHILEPGGIAAGGDGTVFVVDSARSQIHLFRDGAFAATWGERGTARGQLNQPHGIALLGDRLIVADTGNRRLQIFEPDGRFVTAWGGVGHPWDVAIAADGRVLVTDNDGDQVVFLDGNGVRLGALGRSGNALGELDAPKGITVWPDGRLAIADSGNGRVQVWDANGAFAAVITNTSLLPVVDVAAAGDGHLLVAELRLLSDYDLATGGRAGASRAPVPGGFASVAYQPTSTLVTTPTVWTALSRDYLTGLRSYWQPSVQPADEWLDLPGPAGEFASPRRIQVVDDTAYVLDSWPRIQRLVTDGTPLDQIQVTGASEIAPDGANVFVAGGESVRQLTSGAEIWSWTAATSTWLVGLVHDPAADRLYTLDLRSQQLLVLDTAGILVNSQPLGTSGYQSFTDLAQRADGHLMLVNRSRSEVEIRDTDGSLLDRWPIRGVPLRVAADDSGGAFVLTREGWVWKLGPGGQVLAWWDAAAAAGAGAADRRGSPSDIAVAGDGRVFVLDARFDRVLVFAPDPSATPDPAPSGSGCTFVRDKWAAPPRIHLGETVGVTLTLAGECVGEGQGADIVLVIDRSGSMVGQKIQAARDAAISFVGETDFNVSRVGVVVFNLDATTPISLTADAAAVVDAIVGFGNPISGTDIGEGVQLAAAELTANGRPGVPAIMIVMTDGRPEGDVIDADEAATAAKAAGIRLFSVGFGTDADPELMRRVASSAADYFFAPTSTELSGIYTEIARRISGGIIMRTTVITDVVPVNMLYLPGSASPPVVSYANRMLRWEFQDVRGELTLGYRLRPLEVGVWPTNDEARSRLVDGHDVPGEIVFPRPQVVVVSTPRPIYLPVVGGRICRPEEYHADVALVIDSSSTMTGDKLAAAQAAARTFIDLLALPADQAAIIGFNRDARLEAGLTGDRAALHAAIDRLAIVPGTVIDAGLQVATHEFQSARTRPGNRRVIVLLTDGRNNAGPAPVLAATEEARSLGIVIYTVAFGSDADRELMRQVAGHPGRAYVAATAADLVRIYSEIAGFIPCP